MKRSRILRKFYEYNLSSCVGVYKYGPSYIILYTAYSLKILDNVPNALVLLLQNLPTTLSDISSEDNCKFGNDSSMICLAWHTLSAGTSFVTWQSFCPHNKMQNHYCRSCCTITKLRYILRRSYQDKESRKERNAHNTLRAYNLKRRLIIRPRVAHYFLLFHPFLSPGHPL